MTTKGRPRTIKVEVGKRYGHLVVVMELSTMWVPCRNPTRNPRPYRMVLLDCDCGNTVMKKLVDLRQGQIRSCGYLCPYRGKHISLLRR